MRPATLLLLLLASVSLAAAGPLQAQVRVDGIVIDDATGKPVSAARVEVFDGWGRPARSRRADSLGHFQVPLRRLGVYRMRVRAPGYPPVSQLLVTEAFPYYNIEVRVRQGASLLAPVTILARAQSMPRAEMEQFHFRLRSGRGSYITRDDVESVRPGHISDMISWAPGVAIRRGGEGGEDRLLIARRVVEGRLTECPLRVLVDGELVNPRGTEGEVTPAAIDATVDQTMVDGIEIYVDAHNVPGELRAVGGCGAVAVWTRNGRGATPPQTPQSANAGSGSPATPTGS